MYSNVYSLRMYIQLGASVSEPSHIDVLPFQPSTRTSVPSSDCFLKQPLAEVTLGARFSSCLWCVPPVASTASSSMRYRCHAHTLPTPCPQRVPPVVCTAASSKHLRSGLPSPHEAACAVTASFCDAGPASCPLVCPPAPGGYVEPALPNALAYCVAEPVPVDPPYHATFEKQQVLRFLATLPAGQGQRPSPPQLEAAAAQGTTGTITGMRTCVAAQEEANPVQLLIDLAAAEQADPYYANAAGLYPACIELRPGFLRHPDVVHRPLAELCLLRNLRTAPSALQFSVLDAEHGVLTLQAYADWSLAAFFHAVNGALADLPRSVQLLTAGLPGLAEPQFVRTAASATNLAERNFNIPVLVYQPGEHCHVVFDPSFDGSQIHSMMVQEGTLPEQVLSPNQEGLGLTAWLNGAPQSAMRRPLRTGDFIQFFPGAERVRYPVGHPAQLYGHVNRLHCLSSPLRVPPFSTAAIRSAQAGASDEARNLLVTGLDRALRRHPGASKGAARCLAGPAFLSNGGPTVRQAEPHIRELGIIPPDSQLLDSRIESLVAQVFIVT
eukprot:s9841_g2.t1